MAWTTPAFEDINMSAEIGGYQGDYGDGNVPPVLTPEPATAQIARNVPRGLDGALA